MPLEDAQGKYSYSLETKCRLFTVAHRAFEAWHDRVFFYLCMEDPRLWEPALGRAYASNEEFEKDMLASYRAKIHGMRA